MSKLATWLGGHDEVRDGKQPVGRHRVAWVLLCALVILAGVELAAQVREHLLSGRTARTTLVADSEYVVDPVTGLRLLRPNATLESARHVLRTNSLGLRSDELATVKPQDEFRVIVIGASNVMGVFAASNSQTLPSLLEQELRARWSPRNVRVVNAGIAGSDLAAQGRMLKWLAERLTPDLVLFYSGANDISTYCWQRLPSTPHESRFGLPQLELPLGLQSVDLLLKNTAGLRRVAFAGAAVINAAELDTSDYRRRLVGLVQTAAAHRVRIVLATSARGYRAEQPVALQQQLATMDLKNKSCFDLAGLHTIYRRHNAVIHEVGAALGVPVVPIGELIPGGPDYFVDSTHFSERGIHQVVKHYAEFLTHADLNEPGARP